ncbi:MAG: HAMP domain-containing sensor histidine kinase [Bacteroidales bacterium]
MREKVKKGLEYFFAIGENLALEQRLFLTAVIIGMFVCILGAGFALLLSGSLTVIIITMTVLAVLSVIYYLARVKGILKPLAIPLVVISFIAVSVIWIYNGGIDGSSLFVGFVVLILGLIIVPDRARKYIISIFILFSITIYLIQLYKPELIREFSSETARWLDSIVSIIYSSFFIFLIIRFLHNNYKAEKDRAEEGERILHHMNAGKDRFISILSHDLRSPFNSILGFSEVLANDFRTLTPEEIGDIALRINKSAKNTYNLLEDILLWASSHSGKVPFKPQIIPFDETCRELLKLLSESATKKEITISCLTTANTTVYADPDMFKLIIRNLLSNAIKFTNTGGIVTVNAEETDAATTVSVTDTGVGLTKDLTEKLFDISQPFTTSGTSGEKGTGIGLLLCKEFVDKHGGKIWVESEPEKGSVFRFTLPLPNASGPRIGEEAKGGTLNSLHTLDQY